MSKHILDFKQLATSFVYAFDEPDEKIPVLNKLKNQCISEHAPIKRKKFTRPPAPWLKDPEISMGKNVLDNLRTKSRDLNRSDLTVRPAEGVKFSKPKRSMGDSSTYNRSTKKTYQSKS